MQFNHERGYTRAEVTESVRLLIAFAEYMLEHGSVEFTNGAEERLSDAVICAKSITFVEVFQNNAN